MPSFAFTVFAFQICFVDFPDIGLWIIGPNFVTSDRTIEISIIWPANKKLREYQIYMLYIYNYWLPSSGLGYIRTYVWEEFYFGLLIKVIHTV